MNIEWFKITWFLSNRFPLFHRNRVILFFWYILNERIHKYYRCCSNYLMTGVSPRAVETWPCSVSMILSSEYNCIGVLNWACTILTPGSSISRGTLGAILDTAFSSVGQMELTVLMEEGVLRPLPQSSPEGVLHPLCPWPRGRKGCSVHGVTESEDKRTGVRWC